MSSEQRLVPEKDPTQDAVPFEVPLLIPLDKVELTKKNQEASSPAAQVEPETLPPFEMVEDDGKPQFSDNYNLAPERVVLSFN